MLNFFRSWFRRPPSLNTLHRFLKDLPVPLPCQQDAVTYQAMQATLTELFETAEANHLTADLFRLLLNLVAEKSQLHSDPIQKIKLEKMSGTWSSEMECRHWAVPLLVQNLAQLLIEQGGPNFIEIPLVHTREPQAPIITITIQKITGKSPATLLAETKQELEALKTNQKIYDSNVHRDDFP